MDITVHKPLIIGNKTIHLPGSKSISNRLLIIKALSKLSVTLSNISNSDDTKHLQTALECINKQKSTTINIGHAGTDMRFLTAYLATQEGTWHLTGSERMQQRPIKELVDVLIQLGADITYENKEGFPPLTIKGKKILGGAVSIDSSISSQFISALLLVAPYFQNGLLLTLTNSIVSVPYITMTLELMKEFGANITWKENTIIVFSTPYQYAYEEYSIESDWSAASYFYSMVALSPTNTMLSIEQLNAKSLQADSACVELFSTLGVSTLFEKNKILITKTHTTHNTTLFKLQFY